VRKIILKNNLSPGDILMLTAAVRDLHLSYPGCFATDVRTSSPPLWENNPFLTPLSEEDPAVETIDCAYPLINESNTMPVHFTMEPTGGALRRLCTTGRVATHVAWRLTHPPARHLGSGLNPMWDWRFV
jgi:hypothetical protein